SLPISSCAGPENAKLISISPKKDARLITTSQRVAPLKSGKAIDVEPDLSIVIFRLNANASRCHGAAPDFASVGHAPKVCRAQQTFPFDAASLVCGAGKRTWPHETGRTQYVRFAQSGVSRSVAGP